MLTSISKITKLPLNINLLFIYLFILEPGITGSLLHTSRIMASHSGCVAHFSSNLFGIFFLLVLSALPLMIRKIGSWSNMIPASGSPLHEETFLYFSLTHHGPPLNAYNFQIFYTNLHLKMFYAPSIIIMFF